MKWCNRGDWKTDENWITVFIYSAEYQRADELFHGVLCDVATELSQPTKVADTDEMTDMLFYGQLGVLQHSQITDNVDRFHYHGANGEGVFVTGKTTKRYRQRYQQCYQLTER